MICSCVFWRNRSVLPLSYAILAKGHGCAGHSLPPSHARGVAAQTLSLVRGPAAVVGRPCDVQGNGDPPQARSAKEKSYCSFISCLRSYPCNFVTVSCQLAGRVGWHTASKSKSSSPRSGQYSFAASLPRAEGGHCNSKIDNRFTLPFGYDQV